jgi:hypothetical protein
MRGAANHPRALSQAEKEYRMEGSASSFGGNWLEDAFRWTPAGMIADAAQGRDTVFSGRGGAGYGGSSSSGIGGLGGNAAAMVGTTMPFREVPFAGVIDHARSGAGKPKFPLATNVQVGNSDGSGRPQVGCAWYSSLEDFKGGRNRMMESKKIGRMTKMPEDMPTDLSEDEMAFMEDMFGNAPEGAGFYGGEWYNNWDDFTEAISEAYDTVKGVWEDYIKPVLDVVGTPLKDALLSSGNPYGEAGAGVLELLGYGMADGNGIGGRPGISGGMYGAPGGHSGGAGSDGNGMMGYGEGVFADAKPIPANSLGFSPKLEVEQLNAATGSTSYGDMPTSNPVGSGIGGRKRVSRKNDSGASSAPIKMGEELVGGISAAEAYESAKAMGQAALENIIMPSINALATAIVSGVAAVGVVSNTVMRAAQGLKAGYNRDDVQTLLRFAMANTGLFVRFLPVQYQVAAWAVGLLKAYFSIPEKPQQPRLPTPPQRVVNPDDPNDPDGDVVDIGRAGAGRKGGEAWYEKLLREMPKDEAYPGGQKIQPGGDMTDRRHRDPFQTYGDETTSMKGGRKISRKTTMKEREGLLVSGDNSMGTTMASRGYTSKAQKASGAVVTAPKDIWTGSQFENLTGRSGTKNPSLVLEGGAMSGGNPGTGGAVSGGAHPLIQTNNLQAVYGGAKKMKPKPMKDMYGGSGIPETSRKGRPNAYGAMVRDVMKQRGCRLPEAVKHIKENNLYVKKSK